MSFAPAGQAAGRPGILVADGDVRDEYTVFCEGVRSLTQVDLLHYKRGQMERRVRTFAERRGATDLAGYLVDLRRRPGELDAFLDRVTINGSHLWRNPEQWRVLAGAVLPELARTGRVRAWSAGCSYGAEAYTLAATMRSAIPACRGEIRGTDIGKRMIERARTGHFSPEDGRDAPRAELGRFFDVADDGGWQARRELKAMTRFEVGDLLRLRPQREAFDLVLCRNTVIHFNEEVRDALHARLVESLRPGGYLIVGATERVADTRGLGLTSVHAFTYRKR